MRLLQKFNSSSILPRRYFLHCECSWKTTIRMSPRAWERRALSSHFSAATGPAACGPFSGLNWPAFSPLHDSRTTCLMRTRWWYSAVIPKCTAFVRHPRQLHQTKWSFYPYNDNDAPSGIVDVIDPGTLFIGSMVQFAAECKMLMRRRTSHSRSVHTRSVTRRSRLEVQGSIQHRFPYS